MRCTQLQCAPCDVGVSKWRGHVGPPVRALGEPFLGKRSHTRSASRCCMVTLRYLQAVNEIVAEVQPTHIWANDGPDAELYGLEPNFGCCTANFNQGGVGTRAPCSWTIMLACGTGWPKYANMIFFTTPDGARSVVRVFLCCGCGSSSLCRRHCDWCDRTRQRCAGRRPRHSRNHYRLPFRRCGHREACCGRGRGGAASVCANPVVGRGHDRERERARGAGAVERHDVSVVARCVRVEPEMHRVARAGTKCSPRVRAQLLRWSWCSHPRCALRCGMVRRSP